MAGVYSARRSRPHAQEDHVSVTVANVRCAWLAVFAVILASPNVRGRNDVVAGHGIT